MARASNASSRASSRTVLSFLLPFVVLAGCVDAPEREEDMLDGPAPDADLVTMLEALHESRELRFETDHGTIRMLLYDTLMPRTAGRIGALAADGFYDDTIVHRVVDEFVIQGGDPSETGLLGSGQTIAFERDPRLLFGAGALGLARDVDPDSGDSQWFVTEKPAPHLSDDTRTSTGPVFGTYALFGQVFEGMEVVRSIAGVQVVPGADRPVQDVMLDDAQVLDPPHDIDLLQYPPTIQIHDGTTYSWILQRPLHLVADHPVALTLYLTPAEEGPAPGQMDVPVPDHIDVAYASEGGRTTVRLVPRGDDPLVYQGTLTLPAGGAWTERVEVGAEDDEARLEVLPWHDAYQRFTGDGQNGGADGDAPGHAAGHAVLLPPQRMAPPEVRSRP